MDTALRYLAARPRTEREMLDYLDEKGFGEYEVDSTVERLRELGYVDDAAYAKNFVSSRLRSKPISKAHLWRQLLQHKLDKELIEQALQGVDDETELENARQVAKKYARQFLALDKSERKKRVSARLQGRGFSFYAISHAIALLEDESGEGFDETDFDA